MYNLTVDRSDILCKHIYILKFHITILCMLQQHMYERINKIDGVEIKLIVSIHIIPLTIIFFHTNEI